MPAAAGRTFCAFAAEKRSIEMGKGGYPRIGGQKGGGKNMGNVLAQAQKMQEEMAKAQEALAEKEVAASVGGGVVNVRVNGKKELLEVKIAPDAVDPDDVEMLEDLLVAAVNEAMRKADEMTNDEMGKITGGLSIPGLF